MTPRLVVVNDAAWQKIAAAGSQGRRRCPQSPGMAWADSQIIEQEKRW